MKRALGLGLVIGALVLGVALVPAANAATIYYATPSGGATSGSCTQSTPCTMAFALTKLGSGDTLRLLPGKYDVPALGATCSTAGPGVELTNDTLEGIPGRPRPTLDLTKCQAITAESGGVVRNVSVIEPDLNSGSQNAPIAATAGGTLDGIVDPGNFGAIIDGTGTIENSFSAVILFQDSGGMAINDTAQVIVAEGFSQNGQDTNSSATVVNSIANKFEAFSINGSGTNPPNATASMTLSYYAGTTVIHRPPDPNFGTKDGTITADHPVASGSTPLNLAPDGVHETANSPTVDAGTETIGAPTDDFDGGTRSFNGAPDVGADEFGTGLPTLNTITATNVTYKSATLRGTINTNEIDNPSVRFLYGKGTSRTLQTPAQDVPASTSIVVHQAIVTGLTPSTTYTFLIESGSQQAQVVTFHTPKKPQPFNGVVFEQHSSQATSKHVVALQLFCPTSTVGFCKGALKLTSGRTILGSHTFLANHGNLFTVHITLTAAAFRQLVTKRTETVLGTAAAHDANGTRKTTTASITLKAPPKR
jgi:hypothetical protein